MDNREKEVFVACDFFVNWCRGDDVPDDTIFRLVIRTLYICFNRNYRVYF